MSGDSVAGWEDRSMEKHFSSLHPATLFKGKARDVDEMALMFRNPGVKALPASGPW